MGGSGFESVKNKLDIGSSDTTSNVAKGGGSRAAKKRARAKAKAKAQKKQLKEQKLEQQQQQQQQDETGKISLKENKEDMEERKILKPALKKRKKEKKRVSKSKISKDDDDDDLSKENKEKNAVVMENDIAANKNDDNDNDDDGNKNERKKSNVKFTPDTNFEVKAKELSVLDEFLDANNMAPPVLYDILYPPKDHPENHMDVSMQSNDNNENDDDHDKEGFNPDDASDARKNINAYSTAERAKLLLSTILYPTVTLEQFYAEYWEKKPLLIPGNGTTMSNNNDKTSVNTKSNKSKFPKSNKSMEHRLSGFLTKKEMEQLLKTQSLRYGKDINVTNYIKTKNTTKRNGKAEDKRRITLDLLPDKTPTKEEDYVLIDPKDVWANFNNEKSAACTLRLLCPQKYIDPIHSLLSLLEIEWGCMVGANVYLTPPQGAQGFAPHYDDIEAFILQLEGEKHWKVYPPFPGSKNVLPRCSSRDFTEMEMKNHKPIIDVILKPGDVLYMPRGWIHQAYTISPNDTISSSSSSSESMHSLHLTVSAMQTWAWTDLMEILIPDALHTCTNESLSLREGLPRNFINYMGIMHQSNGMNEDGEEVALSKEEAFYEDDDIKQKRLSRQKFKEEAKKRIMRVCKEVSFFSLHCEIYIDSFEIKY